MNSYSDLNEQIELLINIVRVLFGLLIVVVIRNWYNLYKKRSYRKKNKQLQERLSSKQTIIHKYEQKGKNNHANVSQLKEQISSLKKRFYKELNEKERKIVEQEEKIKYQKKAYESYVGYKSVEANNTRLGAHFVKNVISQIYEDLEEIEASYKSVFGYQYKKEKESKKLPSIKALKSVFKLLDYNVAALNKESITLEKELEHIQMFLNLINYLKPKAKIEFNNFLNDKQKHTIKIKPTLFFPFVENALKHGSLNDNNSFISIDLKQHNQKQISYSLINSVTKTTDDPVLESSAINNFGLNSLEQLISAYYPGSKLECRMLPNKQYLSELIINLN